MKISSLHLRLLSGFTLGPLFVLAIYYGGFAFQAVVAIAFGLSVKEWMGMAQKSNHVIRDAIMGLVYLLIPYASFLKLRLDLEDGMYLTIILFLAVMISDVSAYFAGKHFGGAKLLPSISPNKTWAGLIGGMVGSMIFIVVANIYHPFLSLPVAIIVGVAFTIVGQIGDLIMSMYKRRVGVKDTGNLIPGHGGILDRIDSLILATPFFLVVVMEFSL